MIDFLYSVDLSIFYFINHSLSCSALDKFFSIITNVNNWFIAYLILLGISFFKGGSRGKIAVLGIILLIILTDRLNATLVKDIFHRLRPCNTLKDAIIPLGCNGTFSFPSNHAVNNFAAAVFFYKLFPKLKWLLFITASLVALSRVYLGLHYPSDILGGAVIGSAFGYLFALGAIKLDEFLKMRNNRLAK
jgi:undecaprenyl-diphosphatase